MGMYLKVVSMENSPPDWLRTGMRSSFQLVWIAQWVCLVYTRLTRPTDTNFRCSGTAGLIWMTIMVWFFMLAVIASMSVSLPSAL
jgi:hypothetical protein